MNNANNDEPLFPPTMVHHELPYPYKLRPLYKHDYNRGICDILAQLTEVGDVSREQFYSRFYEIRHSHNHFVVVIEDQANNRVVATGTLFLEKKFIHSSGIVGHIEDVVVDSSVRGKDFGRVYVAFHFLRR